MASSRKSSRSRPAAGDLAARVAKRVADIVKPASRLTVGLSGGADSVVLLDCLHRAARPLRLRLSALHVNHQLSPDAARWAAFCRRLCRARSIPFESVKVKVPRGAELETAARAARYEAFARQDCDCIVLAHHLDDQVETLLLQLLRGAGVKGLAAMPALREAKGTRDKGQGAPRILRPLLDTTREEILAYARERELKWVEDGSNSDTRFRRNFLRHEILPAIERRFPAYRATVARSASHLAEASRVLDEVAAGDGAVGLSDGALSVASLRQLTPARARNLLRYFLAASGVEAPSTARLEEALRQALAAKRDARVEIELGGARLMRFAGGLHVVGGGPAARYSRRWRGEARLAVPEAAGVLTFTRGKGKGINLARLRGGAVTVRPRSGGERIQPDCSRPRRSLKKLFQEAGVAPWLRDCLPLIFHGETLVWVPGIGVDCAFQAGAGEAALLPSWSRFA